MGLVWRRGFSLIEIMTVVVILAIIGAIAVPRYGRAATRYRVEAAAERLRADLELARESAKRQSRSVAVTFASGANSGYVITGVRDLDGRAANTYRVELWRAPYEVRIESVSGLASGNLVFDGFGVSDSAPVVTLAAGAWTRSVAVESGTGVVRATKP